MDKIQQLTEDEREGNKGRREWLKGEHPVHEWKQMLEGACNSIDRLLKGLGEAYTEGVGVGRQAGDLLVAEARRRYDVVQGQAKDLEKAKLDVEISKFHMGDKQ